MANKVKRIVLSDRDRAELRGRVASKSLPAREVERARIVLLAEEGLAAREVAELVGCSEPTVLKWRAAYERHGLRGLEDGPRSGRPLSRWIGPEETPPL